MQRSAALTTLIISTLALTGCGVSLKFPASSTDEEIKTAVEKGVITTTTKIVDPYDCENNLPETYHEGQHVDCLYGDLEVLDKKLSQPELPAQTFLYVADEETSARLIFEDDRFDQKAWNKPDQLTFVEFDDADTQLPFGCEIKSLTSTITFPSREATIAGGEYECIYTGGYATVVQVIDATKYFEAATKP